MIAAGVVGRIGGLAAVLGAGVVVGLAVAAPASADNSRAQDAGPRAAASDKPAEHPVARPSPRAVAVAQRGRAVRSAPAAAVTAPKAPTHREPRPVSTEPVRAAAAAGVARTAALPTAPAPAASAVGLLAPADPRGRLITVYKGTHFVLPGSPAFFIKQVSGTGTFTANSAYDLKDVDQYDWNKFTGIVFSPLQHDRNSVMVGWRYNLTTKEFEIAPFYNVNKERVLPNEQTEVISVPAGESFQYTVDYNGVTIGYADKTVFKPYPSGLTPNRWTASRVSGWFGGNEAAPRTLNYYLNLK